MIKITVERNLLLSAYFDRIQVECATRSAVNKIVFILNHGILNYVTVTELKCR